MLLLHLCSCFSSYSNTYMNNTFSLEQISKRGNLDSNLILRQFKLDLKAKFMKNKMINPKLGPYEVAKDLGCSSSILQRLGQDVNML